MIFGQAARNLSVVLYFYLILQRERKEPAALRRSFFGQDIAN